MEVLETHNHQERTKGTRACKHTRVQPCMHGFSCAGFLIVYIFLTLQLHKIIVFRNKVRILKFRSLKLPVLMVPSPVPYSLHRIVNLSL